MKTRKLLSIFAVIISYFILGGMVAPINSLFQITVNQIPRQVKVNQEVEITSEIKNRALMLQNIRFGEDYFIVTTDLNRPEDKYVFGIMYTDQVLPFESTTQTRTVVFSTPGIHKINIYAKFYIGDEVVMYEDTIYIEVIE